ncbi:MAG: TolC family protein [Bacteroidales bacterium]|nr:TolC family protein [Bacteroidales bacterium]
MKTTRKILIACHLLLFSISVSAQTDTLTLNLYEVIKLAQRQSVDAAVAVNELKKAYWEYHTFKADQLPEINFTGTLPSYKKNYERYLQSDGSYTYLHTNSLGLEGEISVLQNISLTGGKIFLNTSLDFTHQTGSNDYNEFMSLPVNLILEQPVFGVNKHKWNRRIEPLRYKEAKAAYIESVEEVTIHTIRHFFNLLLAKENLNIAFQNHENADKLYEIALAKREIGYISESEVMQLNLSALQAKGFVTEALSDLNANMFGLRSFLGLDETIFIEPVMPEYIPYLKIEYSEALEKALENNSFAQSILRQQMEADYAVETAKGNQRNISLYASIGYSGKGKDLESAYKPLDDSQVIQVGVTIPLLDWGKRKGKVKVAESNREVTLSQIKREEMNFNQNIFLLVENFNNQAGQLEIAKQADIIAEKRYETSIETFMIGKINVLDLSDAQRSKDEAKIKHIQELYEYWDYYYNIHSLTLYDFIEKKTLDAEFEEIIL